MPQESLQLISHSEDATRAIGKALAEVIEPGAVVALIGDLGAGKTRLVQAFAHALGAAGAIQSPTFTLIHEYQSRLPLRHCDTYRLRDPDEFADLGLDELFAPDGVALVEWADRVLEWLPRDHLRVAIAIESPTDRRLELTAHGRQSTAILHRLRERLRTDG